MKTLQERWNRVIRIAAALLLLLIVALVVGAIAGCATDHLTKDEVRGIAIECLSVPACMVAKTTALKADKIYEAEDSLIQYQDTYRQTVLWCASQAQMSMWRNYRCHSRLDECVPDHVTQRFGCWYTSEILRQLGIR